MTATLERPALRYRSAHQRKSARADAAGLRWVAGDLISYGPTPTDPSVRQTLRARAADTLAQIEAAITAALIDAWGAQEQLVLGRLRGRKARAGTRHWTVPNGKPVVTKDIDPDYVLPDAGVQAVVDAVSPVIANELGPAIQGAFARITPGPTADPIGVRSSIVQDAISREIERLTGLVGADADRVRAVISNADATDKDLDGVLDDVRDHYSNTPARAEMRARMVAIGGLNGGSLDVARSMGVTSKEWLCFAPGTVVSAAGVTHVARRWHDGSMTKITVRVPAGRFGGTGPALRVLTVTPDHPLLTGRGWVPASEVRLGDHTFGGTLVDPMTLGDPDVQHVPATIEEVFAAADRRSPGQREVRVVLDFDGESYLGERHVDVVPVDRELRNVLHAHAVEELPEDVLVWSDLAAASCLADQRSGRELVRAHLDTEPFVTTSNHRAHGVLSVNQPTHASGSTLVAEFDSCGLERAEDRLAAGSNLTTDPTEGLPLGVAAFEVIDIKIIPWSGHVYDLSVDTGWLLAGGMIAHNSSHDDRVRNTHQVADRQVQNIDDPFEVGGHRIDYPGDPSGLPATGSEVYGCRCSLTYSRPPAPGVKVQPWQLQAGGAAVQTALDQVAQLLQGPTLGSPADDLADPGIVLGPRTALLSAPLVGWRTASADAIPVGVGEQFNAPLPMSLTLLRQQAAGTAVAPDLLVRVEVPGNGQVVSWDGSSAEIVVPAGAQLFVVARDDQQVTLRVVPPPGALGD